MEATPLPLLESLQVRKLRLGDMPNRHRAYCRVLRAEWLANQQQAEENAISARVAGDLLEFHARPPVFYKACESVVEQVMSPPWHWAGEDEWDVVFCVGKFYLDNLSARARLTT